MIHPPRVSCSPQRLAASFARPLWVYRIVAILVLFWMSMGKLVVMGAMCQCTMGTAPCTLIVTPANKVDGCKVPAATVNDKEVANLPSFIMCTTQSNPAVAAATSAAMGTPTPAPCVPVIGGPWSPGAAKTTIGGIKAL